MLIHQGCGTRVKSLCLEQPSGSLAGILICPACSVSVPMSECNGTYDITDQVYAANFNESTQVVTGDDHINIRDGFVLVAKVGSAANMTIDPPIPGGANVGGNDGVAIRFLIVVSAAHTVTTAPGKFMPGNKTICTMVPPSSAMLIAYNGQWYLAGPSGGTLS